MRSTKTIVTVNGKHCRVWDGINDRGARVQVYVAMLKAEGDRELDPHCIELEEPKVETLRA